jgi:hypothetical protein
LLGFVYSADTIVSISPSSSTRGCASALPLSERAMSWCDSRRWLTVEAAGDAGGRLERYDERDMLRTSSVEVRLVGVAVLARSASEAAIARSDSCEAPLARTLRGLWLESMLGDDMDAEDASDESMPDGRANECRLSGDVVG